MTPAEESALLEKYRPMGCIGCLEVKPDDFCSFGVKR